MSSQPSPQQSGSPQNGEAQANPVLTMYNDWVERTPFVTRSSLIGIVVIYLLSWIVDFTQQLGNVPYFTILNFEVYRIITSPFVGNSIFSIIMIFLFFPQMGGRIESSIGSSGYLALMFTMSLLTNILFVATCYLLYFMGMYQAIFWNCSGFWAILFSFITIDCLQMPDSPRQMMFIPVDIPSKYFPLVLYGFFMLFSGPDLSLFIAMVIGYLYSQGYLDKLRLSSYYLESLEAAGGLFHGISRRRGWVLAGTTGHDAWIAVNTADQDMNQSQSRSSNPMRSGFPNIGGFGNLSSNDDDEESGGQKKDATPFPGSGHKLAPTTGASSFLSSSSSSSSQASKEVIAQRRLAALAGNANSQP